LSKIQAKKETSDKYNGIYNKNQNIFTPVQTDKNLKNLFTQQSCELSDINDVDDGQVSYDNDNMFEFMRTSPQAGSLRRKVKTNLYNEKTKPFKFLILPPKRSLSSRNYFAKKSLQVKYNQSVKPGKIQIVHKARPLCVDLLKINQKLKTFSNLNYIDIADEKESEKFKLCSLIIEGIESDDFKEKLDKIILSNIEELKCKINDTVFKHMKVGIIAFKGRNKNKSGKMFNKLIYKPISLQPNDLKVPESLKEIRNYLAKHFESEEKNKLVYSSRVEKLFNEIRKKLRSIDLEDHGLLNFINEKWEIMNISYNRRLEFLNVQLNIDYKKIYYNLEQESESLSEYYFKTEGIYEDIKFREKLKYIISQKIKKSIFIYT
jgi:hypothetical protein